MYWVTWNVVIKQNEICGLNVKTGICMWKLNLEKLGIRMHVAGGLCNRVVERMFLVSNECLDQLTDCDTVTKQCGACSCVGVWQTVQTWQCPTEDSILLLCCTMMTCKLIWVFWTMQVIHLFKTSVTINKLTYRIGPQQVNCQQHHHFQNL